MTPKSWSQIATIVCVCSGFVEVNVWILALEEIAVPGGEAMWAFRSLGMLLAGLFVVYGSEQALDTKRLIVVTGLIGPGVFTVLEVLLRFLIFIIPFPAPEPWSDEGWWWRINFFVNMGIFLLLVGLIVNWFTPAPGSRDKERTLAEE